MTKLKNRIIDVLLVLMIVLPFVGCMVLKVLTSPPTEGLTITGAQIYYVIDMPLQPLYITESTVVSAAVVIAVLGIALLLTRDLSRDGTSVRQIAAEYAVEACDKLVISNMGERFAGFAPFVAAVMALSALSSLSSLLGLYSPTADVSVIGGWAILVFILITHYKLKGGVGNYLKGYLEPIPLLAPLNIISELATPLSMTFRHYGNVFSGTVVSALVAYALSGASQLILSWLPGFISTIPILRLGVPAVLSIYFDVFSGCLQAFIFAMLTMLFVANGFPEEKYEERMRKKQQKKMLESERK